MLTDFVVNEIAQDGTLVTLKSKPNPNANNIKPVVHEKPSYELSTELLQ